MNRTKDQHKEYMRKERAQQRELPAHLKARGSVSAFAILQEKNPDRVVSLIKKVTSGDLEFLGSRWSGYF